MKLKYVLILVVIAFAIGVFLPTQCGDLNIAYWKGRSEQTLKDLKQAEEKFEEAQKKDKELQERKDKRIAELEEGIAKDEQEIEVAEEDIVDARATLKELNLYKGWVPILDEAWKVKYGKLEDKLDKKDKQLKAWQEKFDSKVEVAIKAYTDKDLAQKKVIKELQGLCSAQEKQIKGLKFWTVVGKGLTGYHAVKGGISLVKGIL